MPGGRRRDVLGLDTELAGTRPDPRARREATRARTDRRVRGDATTTADRRVGGRVRSRVRIVVPAPRIGPAHHMAPDLVVVEVVAMAVRVIGRVAERPTDRIPVVPVPIGTGRGPADVVVVGTAAAPDDPRASVRTARDPCPAVAAHVDPAPVVERRPTPRVVRDPDVVRGVVVGPVTGGRIGDEIGPDLGFGGDPDRAVRGIVDP